GASSPTTPNASHQSHPELGRRSILEADGIIPCSPRRRIRLVTVIGGLRHVCARSGRPASANLTPATGARTTRLCRPQQLRSSARRKSLTRFNSPCDCQCAHDAAASTASHPASVTIAIRPRKGWDARLIDLIWVGPKRKYF